MPSSLSSKISHRLFSLAGGVGRTWQNRAEESHVTVIFDVEECKSKPDFAVFHIIPVDESYLLFSLTALTQRYHWLLYSVLLTCSIC